MRRYNVCLTYKEKNYLESFFFLLLIKIKKFQNKNLITLKIREQLMLNNTRNVCVKQRKSIYKKMLFFYAILILDKVFFKEELLKLYYNNSLTKHFEIKKTRTLISRKFY